MKMKNTKPTINMTPFEYETIRKFISLLGEECFDNYSFNDLMESFPTEGLPDYSFLIDTPIYDIEIQYGVL